MKHYEELNKIGRDKRKKIRRTINEYKNKDQEIN